MASWRFCLLLLLTVLLPLRGAVAAAMPCAVGGSEMRTALGMGGHAGAHAAGHATGHAATPAQVGATMAHDAAGAHDRAAGAHDAHHAHGTPAVGDGHANPAPAGTEGCNACAASCSAAPLVHALPTMPAPLDPAAVEFAERSAPPPSHLVGGLERPPRTL